MGAGSLTKKEKNSSVELLRIVAMLFVVMSHSSVHGGFPKGDVSFSFDHFLLDQFVLGNLGVNIFVMISGYYLCTKRFKIQSVIKLLVQVWFFSWLGLLIYLFTGNSASLKEIVKAILPTLFAEYWFFTVYLVLLLLSPYLNIFIAHADRKQMSGCLSVMVVLWSIIPTFTMQVMYGGELPQFVMLYMMGAYLNKYPDGMFSRVVSRRLVMISCGVLLPASAVVLRCLSAFVPALAGNEIMLYSRTSVLVIGLAVSLVAAAVYRRPWTNKYVNAVSSCAFGVYLFHDHPLIRKVLWTEWLNNDAYIHSGTLLVRLISSVLMVYAVGSVVEYLRQRYVARPMSILVENAFMVIKKAVTNVSDKASALIDRL